MLTAQIQSTGRSVIARNVTKNDGPFVCKGCDDAVIIKKGVKVVHHFAHRADSSCEHRGESQEHMAAKQEIYDRLCEMDWLECEMEKVLFGRRRSDVYVRNRETGQEIAIEVQLSNLTAQEITERTESYAEMGIYVLWLPLWSEFEEKWTPDDRMEGRYAPRHWEKWLHELNGGELYYWVSGLTVKRVRFKTYHRYVEEYKGHGGHYVEGKRHRKPVFLDNWEIDTAFDTKDTGKIRNYDDAIFISPSKILSWCLEWAETSELFLSPQGRVELTQYRIEEARREAEELAAAQAKAEEDRIKAEAEKKRISDRVELCFLLGDWEPAPGEVERLAKEDPDLLVALQREKRRREDERRWQASERQRQAAEAERQRIAAKVQSYKDKTWIPSQAEGDALQKDDPELFKALVAESRRQHEEAEYQRRLEQKRLEDERFINRCRLLWKTVSRPESKDFVQSIAEKFKEYGSLTDGQQARIQQMFTQYRVPEAQ